MGPQPPGGNPTWGLFLPTWQHHRRKRICKSLWHNEIKFDKTLVLGTWGLYIGYMDINTDTGTNTTEDTPMIYVIRGSEDGNLGATHSAHRAIQRAMEYLGTKDVSMGFWASDPDQRHRATQKEIKQELSEATVVTLVARKSGGWNPTTVDIEAFRPL